MSMWAEIKHALNSTIGTLSFKPLNDIIIYKDKELNASDNIYKVIIPWDSSVSIAANTEVQLCKFSTTREGSIRILVNKSIFSYTLKAYEGTSTTPIEPISSTPFDIKISKNKTYKITITNTSGVVGTIYDAQIGADELDTSCLMNLLMS